MSEFAFTGLGLNPHWPQPPNPAAPDRVPGGSSGGAAVSVALGQAALGLGSDTGGSVRIPAAFCGLAGFKPTQRRITRQGAFPLSQTLDSIGPIAWSIACCRTLDALIADAPPPGCPRLDLAGLRLGVADGYLLEGLDPVVAAAFDKALSSLSAAGAEIIHFAIPELASIPQMNAKGSISNAEAFAWHRRTGLLAQRGRYDPNVRARVELGAGLSGADYLDLIEARRVLIDAAARRTGRFDALIAPTVPIQAPRFTDVAEPDAFARFNGLALRNASVVNLLDRCAATVPMRSDGAPAGLMIVGETLGDGRALAVAEAIEPVVR